MWDASRMPWAPEQFSAPVLERLQEKLGHEVETVPFFDGIIAGEFDALVGSFAGEPELHHPVRGRIRGVRALEAYVADTNAWIGERNISIEQIELVMTERHGFGEAALQLDGETGRVDLPVGGAPKKQPEGGTGERRVSYSGGPLPAPPATRPPLLQPDPDLRESDVVGEYQRALAAGDIEAVVAAFEPDGYAREPAGGAHVHRGADGLRAFYGHLFSGGGGIPLEHCAVVDDGRACALEYNVVRWGETDLPPQAGGARHL